MNRKKAAALALSVTLAASFAGCGTAKEDKGDKGEYIAVYKEISSEEQPDITEEEHIDLPDAYLYSYTDHILFVGGSLCKGLISHGLLPDAQVISTESSVFDGLSELSSDSKTVSELVEASGMKYIYLWTGSDEIASGTDAEDYAKNALSAALKMKKLSKDAMIIILSCPPASKEKAEFASVNEYNKAVRNIVREYSENYDDDSIAYMDISSLVSDNDGYLADVYDYGDGTSLSRTAYRRIMTEIEDKRFYNSRCGDNRYTYFYKDIYAQRNDYTVTEGKVAYLTFDDGPSKYTPEVLEILERNGIKATFFITGWCIEGKEDTLLKTSEAGHTIALHSWSHEYDEIYYSVDAFLDDFSRVYNRVYDITGKKPWAFRFPGGSYNNFNKETADDIIAEMKRRGFSYYDWNCATSDATRSATYESCIEELEGSVYANHSVVLMHDSLELTPQYLQDVIDFLRDEGYSFETIETADEVQFGHN